MSKASRRSSRQRSVPKSRARPGDSRRLPSQLVIGAGAVGLIAIVLVAAVIVLGPGGSSSGAWSRLGTDDVHSLAFVGDDPQRLLFGHHGGVLSSSDGGRTWQPLPTRSDAMSLGAAADGSIVIAGHEVLAASRDDGRSWEDIPASLPSLDIHGFTRDPGDPARMWAYLATGGLWESRDGGASWEMVQQDNVLFPVAVRVAGSTRLFGVNVNGLASSDDGGQTWQGVSTPEIYPIASLAGAADGSVLVAAGQGGLARSDDGGASWSKLPFDGQPAVIAVTGGGQTVAVVTRSTDFFRSDDGGVSWPGP